MVISEDRLHGAVGEGSAEAYRQEMWHIETEGALVSLLVDHVIMYSYMICLLSLNEEESLV